MAGGRSRFRSLIELIALLVIFVVPARAQSPNVPDGWIAYAQLVGYQFQTWLEADDDGSIELRRYLQDRVPNANGDTPPLKIMIRAWVGADGRVSEVEFDSLGDANEDAILHRLLTGHLMTKPPPSDMRQPLRISLHLATNAETTK